MAIIQTEKETRGLQVRTSAQVFYRDRNGRERLRNPGQVYGRIERCRSHLVINKNRERIEYKNDFSKLSNDLKKEIVDQFNNHGSHNRQVLYLVSSRFDRPAQNNTRAPGNPRRRNPRSRNSNRNNNRG